MAAPGAGWRALLTYAWYGYVLVDADTGDLVAQVVFTVLALGLLYVAARRQPRARVAAARGEAQPATALVAPGV